MMKCECGRVMVFKQHVYLVNTLFGSFPRVLQWWECYRCGKSVKHSEAQ